jgi:AraC-like DNA-binding protein
MLHSYLTELFATAMRAASSAPPERGNEMAVIRRTLDYVSRHYRERITVRELAAKSFISESRLFQIFRKHSGEPPLKHALKLRMEKAKTLLAISNMSVSQIADYLGYESVHYFSRAYKKHYKAPPSAERNGV